jgi:hypothetical protein
MKIIIKLFLKCQIKSIVNNSLFEFKLLNINKNFPYMHLNINIQKIKSINLFLIDFVSIAG